MCGSLSPMRTRLLAAPLLLAAVAAGCSDSEPTEQVATQVDREAANQLEVGTDEVTTSCPADAEAKEGVEFDCDITIDDQTLTATVTFETDERFTFVFNGQVFDKAALEEDLKGRLAEGLGAEVVELDCGGKSVVVIGTGDTIECTGSDATGSGGKAIIGLDENGDAVIQDVTN